MTLTRDYFKGLNHIAKIFPENLPNGSGLVYAGDKKQHRTNVTIVPAHQVNDLFQTGCL
jgi:hypothetical protein